MRRLSLCLVAAVGALVIVPAALADGQPLLVTQGGTGVASHAPPRLHYVAISDRAGGTLLETLDVAHGGVFGWARLHGSWGIPAIGTGYSTGQGLSRDGRTVILGSVGSPYVSPSKFLVVDTRRLKAVRTISLDGMFTFDALSPDGSRLYLVQYASVRDLSHYIVRAYDLRAHRLIPGKIAVGSWRISYPGSAFPWAWVGAGIGGGLAIIAAAGAALLLRRRRGEKLEEHAGQELGLA